MKRYQDNGFRKLDNTSKILPMITSRHISNVFRISATLKEKIMPEILQLALEEVLPHSEGFNVRLRRGAFWYYFETSKGKPQIEKESTYPCQYIEIRSNHSYLLRISYFERRINLEIFHAVTDGLGASNFLKELTYRYLDLKLEAEGSLTEAPILKVNLHDMEDSYIKNYKKVNGARARYSTRKAYQLNGVQLPRDAINIIHGYMDTEMLKNVSRSYGVTITKFFVAGLIWTVYDSYLHREPWDEPIGVNLPINLRSFFESDTNANFFALTIIRFLSQGGNHTFEEVINLVSRQIDENIVKERLQETISYNVSQERKWYLRMAPLFIKDVGLKMFFSRTNRAHTLTLTNVGSISVTPKYKNLIERFHTVMAVSDCQNMKCSVCTYDRELVFTFSSALCDTKLQDDFFAFLESKGISVEAEGNGGIGKEHDKGMYPRIHDSGNKHRKTANIFYAALFAITAILGMINYAAYSGFMWSAIAIGMITYIAVTMRYFLMSHVNLGFQIKIQIIGALLLLLLIDYMTGYKGWSVDYAIPGTILLANTIMIFLTIKNPINWQSYFMCQFTLTIFSVIPIILWAVGLIGHLVMAMMTFILSSLILLVVVILYGRNVKDELIRRFHL